MMSSPLPFIDDGNGKISSSEDDGRDDNGEDRCSAEGPTDAAGSWVRKAGGTTRAAGSWVRSLPYRSASPPPPQVRPQHHNCGLSAPPSSPLPFPPPPPSPPGGGGTRTSSDAPLRSKPSHPPPDAARTDSLTSNERARTRHPGDDALATAAPPPLPPPPPADADATCTSSDAIFQSKSPRPPDAARTDSLTSTESARTPRPGDDAPPTADDEVEDEVAELRRMLPMLRQMRASSGAAAVAVAGAAGAATGTAVAAVERAPSPPRMRNRRSARGGGGGRTRSARIPPGSPDSRGSRGTHRSRPSRSPRRRSTVMHHSPGGVTNGVLHGVFTTRASCRGDGGDSSRSSDGGGQGVPVVSEYSIEESDGSGGGRGRSPPPAKSLAGSVILGGAAAMGMEDGGSDSSDSENSITVGKAHTTYVKLSRDVYSLLYFTLPFSIGFFFAVGIFIFQLSVLALIMADIYDRSAQNPFGFPAGVSNVVRTSQALAILIAVATQDDLITSVNAMHTGYDGRLEQRQGVGGHYWQWVVSVGGRFLEGGMCLAVTFILIMQARDVIDLFLDFLAVTFVSTLDNIAFSLAQDGYFSKNLCREAHEVAKIRVPRSNNTHSLFRPTVFFVVSLAMLVGFGIVVHWQNNGHYLSCKRISVQMGDSYRTSLSFFSSVYEMDHFDDSGRPIYVERSNAGADGRLYGRAIFGYCEPESAWTFSYSETPHLLDPCNWYAKSAETYDWDIMSVSSTNEWYVYGIKSKSAKPFQQFSLLCVDCDDSDPRSACSEVGSCSADGRCTCFNGRYGLNCEFEEPCHSLAADTSRGGFPGSEDWSDEFSILKFGEGEDAPKAAVYERPVFTNEYEEGKHHVIMYTGRRWILTDSTSLTDSPQALNQTISSAELANYVTYSFHAEWSEYNARFISSPADVVTPTDASTPVGLDWFWTKSFAKGADEDRPIDTLLLCTRCDNRTNPCWNRGTCGADGTCTCEYGIFGALCQVDSFVLCRTVAVQFGDELISSLPALGGAYALTNRTVSGRSVYLSERRSGAMLAYCQREGAWALTLLPLGGPSFVDADPCDRWKIISVPTDTYDVSSLTTGWSVRRTVVADEGVPLAYFNMFCVDCGRNRRSVPCGGAGQCIDRTCLCDEGKHGVVCQFRDPCPVLEMDPSLAELDDGDDEGGWPGRYEQFRPSNQTSSFFKLYHRPVYISRDTDDDDEAEGSSSPRFLVIFTGRRWVIARLSSFVDYYNPNAALWQQPDLVRYLRDEFHGVYSNFTAELISEPVEANTNMDVASPVDLTWYRPKLFDNKRADVQAPLRTSGPRCAICDNVDHPCYNRGACVNGTCSCRAGTYGTLCQANSGCGSLSVEFGASLPAPLPSLSGDYNRGENGTFGDRPVYVLSPAGGAMLAYCESDRRWTFTHWTDDGQQDVNPPGPCDNWTARSGATFTFDMTETAQWQRRRNATSVVTLPPVSFSYFCNDERRRTVSGGGMKQGEEYLMFR